MERIFVVAGPTASGKTAVSIELAKFLGGEVISADSMQVYRGMDIGTAKPTMEERADIPHHMIDIVDPDVAYSVALFQRQAREVIAEVISRGKVPIVCGGTGFYINALLRDVRFGAAEMDLPPGDYYEELKAADPAAAEAIHPNNIKRVTRALSYIRATGQLFSEYNAAQKEQPWLYDAVFCYLDISRPVLYERINRRVLDMFNAGLLEEVAGLLAKGYHSGLVSMQGIGYKETIRYLQNELSLEDTVALIQQNSRKYAKRQVTWFKHQVPGAIQIPAENCPTTKIASTIALKPIRH